MRTSRAVLDDIAARLGSLLEPLGFAFAPGDQAVSSGGPFATGFFSRAPFHIELIVRDDRLGLPNYRWDPAEWTAGHFDLVHALGRDAETHLLWEPSGYQVVGSNGEAAVDGLIADLAGIILPVLQADPDALRVAITTAHARFQRRLGGGRRRGR